MKRLIIILYLSTLNFHIFSQNIFEEVYNVFQGKCMPCHNTTTNTANLNLEGVGANVAEKMANVYAEIYKTLPTNTTATESNNFLIYPGDPYRSYLYRKIDDGLTTSIVLHSGEGVSMPNNNTSLDHKEIELIRQWILYGAQDTGIAFDKTLLEDFYDNGGVESIENPPAPPEEGEGFQIHLGPYFLAPSSEVEYFSKYDLLLENDLEVYKLSTTMGDFSHHYIVYKFSSLFGNVDPNTVPYGMREGQDFDGREFVSVDQYSNTLKTPEGSAFLWEQNTVLDLNTHYINYSSTQVLKCEIYYNVYYQDNGTANQTMEVALIANTDIPIPNDNVPVTFNYDFQLAQNANIYIWGLIAHTHSYGKDFNIYKKNSDGTRGLQIYDAGCSKGIPGCNLEDFDYTHLPIRFIYPFETVNVQDGLESEATFQNDGPVPVDWGFTSQDEMMIFVAFYVLDTTGVVMKENIDNPEPSPTTINTFNESIVKVFPNPSRNFISFSIANNNATVVAVQDVSGRKVEEFLLKGNEILNISTFEKGMYFYTIKQNNKTIQNGKFIKK